MSGLWKFCFVIGVLLFAADSAKYDEDVGDGMEDDMPHEGDDMAHDDMGHDGDVPPEDDDMAGDTTGLADGGDHDMVDDHDTEGGDHDMPPDEHDAGDDHAGVDDMHAGGDDMVDGDDSVPPEDEHTALAADDDMGGEVDDHGADGAVDDHGGDGAVDDHEGTHENPEDTEDEPLTSEQIKSLHKKIDGNSDGAVSLEELSSFSQGVRPGMAKKETEMGLQQIDANSDGKISLEELLEANFGKIEDHEHGMSKEEEAAYTEKMNKDKELETEKFKLADANKDGFLEKEELASVLYPEIHEEMLKLVVKASFTPKDKDGDGLLTPEEFWGLAAEETGDTGDHTAEFKKLDKDGDGKLNLAEVMAWESGAHHHDSALAHIFEVADKDKDKSLSADELDAARETLHDSIASSHLSSWAEHHEL